MIHGGFWRSAIGVAWRTAILRKAPGGGHRYVLARIPARWQCRRRLAGDVNDIRAAGAFFGEKAARFNIDPERIVVAGHSAGGQLAVWLAGERALPLRGAVSLAGAVDLRRAWDLQLGSDATGEFLGGSPEEFPQRYAMASPMERLPLKVPVRLIHGDDDAVVPLEISEAYAHAACAVQDDVELVRLKGVGHSEVIDPATPAFLEVLSTVRALLL